MSWDTPAPQNPLAPLSTTPHLREWWSRRTLNKEELENGVWVGNQDSPPLHVPPRKVPGSVGPGGPPDFSFRALAPRTARWDL